MHHVLNKVHFVRIFLVHAALPRCEAEWGKEKYIQYTLCPERVLQDPVNLSLQFRVKFTTSWWNR